MYVPTVGNNNNNNNNKSQTETKQKREYRNRKTRSGAPSENFSLSNARTSRRLCVWEKDRGRAKRCNIDIYVQIHYIYADEALWWWWAFIWRLGIYEKRRKLLSKRTGIFWKEIINRWYSRSHLNFYASSDLTRLDTKVKLVDVKMCILHDDVAF